ncbi:ABC transporter ATP-binding protein [Patulibacter sp. NPDC049589]|uniref:ABC transporter ATP-binding protein n=1 Tax=Patulibacter sp. NPDC049589 TaxID=3154731 RepID=UPI00342D66BB
MTLIQESPAVLDPGTTSRLLEVDGLSVRFPAGRGTAPVHAVREVSLTVDSGECLAIVGESGSGKSVTARSLVGLAGDTAQVTASTLEFEGQDLGRLSRTAWRRLRGARIGFVLQDALTSLDPLRRVGDEVGEALLVHRSLRGEGLAKAARDELRAVGIPDPEVRARQYPHELSGGLRQRALIASAIVAGPSLVIADEPTTALDVTVQAQVLDLLAAKKAAGTAVLLISHDIAVVARLADRVAVMYAGLIVEEGPTDEILSRPAHPYTADLLAAVPAFGRSGAAVAAGTRPGGLLAPPSTGPGCPYAGRCALADDRCRSELPPPVPQAAGRSARCWHAGEYALEAATPEDSPARPGVAATRPVLEAREISKRFRSPGGSWRAAVDRVSFTVHAGEALGVVGESGSGKTTTADIVLGMLDPDAGEVRLDDTPWSGVSERERRPRRSRIQIVHQDALSSFDPRYSVEQIIGEALGRTSRRGAAAVRDQIVALLRQVGLDHGDLQRRGASLSGGQRQRVAIARAIAPGPEVLVCDEPVSALDVSVQAQILDLFTRLQRDLGVALLFISHDLGVIHQICDRVLVMKDGAVVESGPVEQLFSTPQHDYTRALISALPGVTPGG